MRFFVVMFIVLMSMFYITDILNEKRNFMALCIGRGNPEPYCKSMWRNI